jgi:hypothetical protein
MEGGKTPSGQPPVENVLEPLETVPVDTRDVEQTWGRLSHITL